MSPNLRHFAGASPAVLALALAATPALAQSFAASGTVVSGLANITTQPNLTEITIDSPEVVINWTPNDQSNSGPILFQPGGTTAIFDTFVSSNVTDYTVLNRIFPTNAVGAINQPVRFEGTVESRVQGVAGRGSLWFYSSTGIIVGDGAAFNVGSLLLTTSNIDTTGGLFGPGGTIRMAGPADTASFVQVNPTANITAGAGGGPSYIAMVAPRVVQSGTIDASGDVALVAAEAADITIGTGLLDIVVTQGSEDANGIVHTGNTTGAASSSLADVQRIQFIAIPKNTAMTMLLSGSIGYAPATLATDDGSAIILSAGVAPYVPQATQDLGLGNISVGNAEFRNVVTGDATNTIDLLPTSGLIDFQAGATLSAGLAINAIADGGEAIQATGILALRAQRAGAGGTITLRALGGTLPGVIAATGSLIADASGLHASSPPVTGPNSLGGAIIVEADGGEISASDMGLNAAGFGGEGLDSGGNGTGGSVSVTISNGGTLAAGTLGLNADGAGGNGFGLGGGNGTGGSTSLRVVDGTLLSSLVDLGARGTGGQSSAQNGNGRGGTSLFEVLGGNQVIDTLIIDANAFAGEPFITGSVAGNAQGVADGAVLHVGTGASLTVNDTAVIRAAGIGAINPAPTGFAQGGEARVLVDGGATLTTSGQFEVDARAEISDESYSPDLLRSPRLQGGTASVIADGGTIDTQGLTVRARATGSGAVNQAGTATGGTAEVIARNGGSIGVANGLADIDLLIDAEGQGGSGPSPAQAQGGTARLIANDATITVGGTARVSASGTEGFYADALAGPGYGALGGTALVEIEAGTAGTGVMGLADIFVRADGNASGPAGGTIPFAGNGGAGSGGSATLAIRAGQFTAAQVSVQALGLGGNAAASGGAAAFLSGSGSGGTARFIQGGGTATTGAISVLATGAGGTANASALGSQIPATGGNGLGGTAEARFAGGGLTAPSLLVDGSGKGGNGMAPDSAGTAPGGNGGNGTGGSALVTFTPGSTALINPGTLTLSAQGLGGNGGAGGIGPQGNAGNGTGGFARFDAGGGGFTLGDSLLDADGIGGNGEAGGSGSGGTSDFRLVDGAIAAAFTRTLASLTLRARGLAGTSASAPAPGSTAGAAGLTAQVASAAAVLGINGDFTALATGATAPAGLGFAASLSGQPLTIGGNSLVQASRDVSISVGAGSALATTGTLSIQTPRTVTSGGLVTAGGNTSVLADLGLSFTDLRSGGTSLLRAVNGAVAVTADLRSTGLVTALGRSVDILGTQALSFADADATAGTLAIRTAGNLNLTTADATGTVTLASTAGAFRATGGINGAGVSIQSLGNAQTDAAVGSTADLTVAAGGTYTALAPLNAGGAVSLSGALGLTAPTVTSGGTTLLSATNGAVNVATALASTGAVTVLGRSASITGSGALTFADADATAGDLVVRGNANLVFATVDATGAVDLATTFGSLTTNGAVNGGSVVLSAPNFVTANGTVTSGGTTLLRAINGPVTVANLLSAGAVTALGRVVDIASTGSLTFADADATAGNLRVQAAGNLDLATVDATGAITLTAGGSIAANGLVRGDTITLTSGNLALGTGGQIGQRGFTRTVTLINGTPANRTFIGGADSATGYSLSSVEARRLFADNAITFAVPATATATGTGDFIIGNLALSYGPLGLPAAVIANVGTGGAIKVISPARVTVNGQVRLTTSSAADLFSIDPTRIEVVGDTGSIAMRSAGDSLLGRLELVGDTILVGTSSAIAGVDAVNSVTEATRVLDSPSTAANDAGYLQAGTLELAASSGIFIQNTGTSSAYPVRRGFTANSLSITTGAPDTQIAINGVLFNADTGAQLTGLQTVQGISINGVPAAAGGAFDPLSTVNGCIIGRGCQSGNPTLTPSDIEGKLQGGDGGIEFMPVVAMREEEQDDLLPLIDEPVTGVGNDDLWQSQCDGEAANCGAQGGND